MTAGIVLVGAVARAQDGPLHIRGVVTDELGAPARDVEVSTTWRPEGRAAVVTGADGAFEFDVPRLTAGGRVIRATSDGGRLQAFVQLPFEEPEVGLGPLKLKLAAAEEYVVEVRDAEGKAVAGATVGLLANFDLVETIASDAEGRATLLAPRDMNERFVFAIHKNHGVDYHAYLLPRGQRGDRKAVAPPLPKGPIKLTLDRGVRVRVQVVEEDGKPIAGMQVYPWLLRKAGEPESLNLSYFVDLVQSTTDARGMAEFAWLPTWNTRTFIFFSNSDRYAESRGEYEAESGDAMVTMMLERLVPLRGRVMLPDGSPADGIEVTADGAGYDIDGFHFTTKTDADGRYEILAAPNKVYLVTARGETWAAEPRSGFAVLPGPAVENLDFQLREATRLFGRVTVGDDERPVAGQQIYVCQYGQDANTMKEGALPNPERSTTWVQPTTASWTKTDEEGRFEVLVGSGKFDIRGPENAEIHKFDVTNQSELEFNFHTDRPEKLLLRGLVVADDAAAVAGSKVWGVYRHELAGQDLEATTDDGGKFEVERKNHPMVLHARSADRQLAGMVEIGADEMVAVIPLRPLATAEGRLVDVAGRPLAGQEIEYGVRVHMGDEDAAFRTCFGGKTITGADGRFKIDELVLEQAYEIAAVVHDEEGLTFWRNIGHTTPSEGGTLELGEFSFDPTE